jgi:serine/threonine-protein kinase
MEFVKGEPLQKLIDEGGTWSVERTLNLLSQICPALHAMHQQNIIHRDMKPANIIIQKEGGFEKAVLLDLGIAKVVRGSNETALIKSITQTGIILGTLQYLAPEQCIAGELDHRVDIYALGIIVYELLTGDLPFQAYSTTAWLISHMQGRPIPLRSVNPSLSEEIEQVVLWALAKKREDRPSSAMEFLERFERAVRDFLGEPEEVFSVPVKLDLDGPPETFERGRITNPNEDNSTSVERGKRTLVSLPEE